MFGGCGAMCEKSYLFKISQEGLKLLRVNLAKIADDLTENWMKRIAH